MSDETVTDEVKQIDSISDELEVDNFTCCDGDDGDADDMDVDRVEKVLGYDVVVVEVEHVREAVKEFVTATGVDINVVVNLPNNETQSDDGTEDTTFTKGASDGAAEGGANCEDAVFSATGKTRFCFSSRFGEWSVIITVDSREPETDWVGWLSVVNGDDSASAIDRAVVRNEGSASRSDSESKNAPADDNVVSGTLSEGKDKGGLKRTPVARTLVLSCTFSKCFATVTGLEELTALKSDERSLLTVVVTDTLESSCPDGDAELTALKSDKRSLLTVVVAGTLEPSCPDGDGFNDEDSGSIGISRGFEMELVLSTNEWFDENIEIFL